MMEEDIELVYSALCQDFEKDGHALDIQIFSTGKNDWILEVVNENGTSIVWDDVFPTDKLAWAEFVSCVAQEGMDVFVNPE